jgi:hypothetical protein
MTTLAVTQLLDMNQEQLDDLFRNSPAGSIPQGEGDGTVIIATGTQLSEIAARFLRFFAWQGKIFNPERGDLRNEITPFGIQAIIAKVYKGESWLDGKECVVLDYSETSIIVQWVRDEIREVAPGLYLGVVYWSRTKLINFALKFHDGEGSM